MARTAPAALHAQCLNATATAPPALKPCLCPPQAFCSQRWHPTPQGQRCMGGVAVTTRCGPHPPTHLQKRIQSCKQAGRLPWARSTVSCCPAMRAGGGQQGRWHRRVVALGISSLGVGIAAATFAAAAVVLASVTTAAAAAAAAADVKATTAQDILGPLASTSTITESQCCAHPPSAALSSGQTHTGRAAMGWPVCKGGSSSIGRLESHSWVR